MNREELESKIAHKLQGLIESTELGRTYNLGSGNGKPTLFFEREDYDFYVGNLIQLSETCGIVRMYNETFHGSEKYQDLEMKLLQGIDKVKKELVDHLTSLGEGQFEYIKLLLSQLKESSRPRGNKDE